MTMVIDGKQTAKEIRAELREEAQRLGIVPGLCVILVGDDPASAIYVRNKARTWTRWRKNRKKRRRIAPHRWSVYYGRVDV